MYSKITRNHPPETSYDDRETKSFERTSHGFPYYPPSILPTVGSPLISGYLGKVKSNGSKLRGNLVGGIIGGEYYGTHELSRCATAFAWRPVPVQEPPIELIR